MGLPKIIELYDELLALETTDPSIWDVFTDTEKANFKKLLAFAAQKKNISKKLIPEPQKIGAAGGKKAANEDNWQYNQYLFHTWQSGCDNISRLAFMRPAVGTTNVKIENYEYDSKGNEIYKGTTYAFNAVQARLNARITNTYCVDRQTGKERDDARTALDFTNKGSRDFYASERGGARVLMIDDTTTDNAGSINYANNPITIAPAFLTNILSSANKMREMRRQCGDDIFATVTIYTPRFQSDRVTPVLPNQSSTIFNLISTAFSNLLNSVGYPLPMFINGGVSTGNFVLISAR